MANQTRAQVDATIAANINDNTTGDISAADVRDVLTDIADSGVWKGEAEFRVVNMTTTTPPVSPSDGSAYVVAAGATGEWAGQDNNIAVWDGGISPNVWVFYAPVNGLPIYNLDDETQYRWNTSGSPIEWKAVGGGGGGGVTSVNGQSGVVSLDLTQCIIVACSDETTALSAGTAKVTFRMPYAFTLSAVRATLTTANSVVSPTSGPVTVDINENGASILSTKLTIDDGEKTSTTAAVAAVISDPNLADDAEMIFDVDVAGTDATGLKVYLIGTKA